MERAEGVIVADRYRLVRKLGSGGMGSVWLAVDLSLDSHCALKLIDDDKAESEEVRIRFEREAKAAAQVRGANVVDVFDHGIFDGIPFIAMEFMDGEDLGARLDKLGKLEPEDAYQLVAQVSRGLARAHSLGIVHRDLKPENIFLIPGDEYEIAKVLDFGIAKHEQYSLRDKTTKTGSFLGTPFYVSPEQARGKVIDHRSDLWSLGVITFQCLTGVPPFESEALGELMGLIMYEDLPKPTQKNPDLPPAIDAWWEKAASRDVETRFQSAKELADALGEALGVTRVLQVPSIPPRRPSPSLADASGGFASIPPVSSELRRSPARASRPPRTPSGGAETTGSPVTRTRSSISLLPSADNLRRRHLIAFAAGGILLGIGITMALLASDGGKPSSAAAANLAPATLKPSVLHAEPTPKVKEPEAAPVPSAVPSASAAPAASGSSEPKKKKIILPQRPRTDTPDYGI